MNRTLLITFASLFALCVGCSSTDETTTDAGAAGSAGTAGSAGSAGEAGAAGSAGSAGTAGTAGQAGQAGSPDDAGTVDADGSPADEAGLDAAPEAGPAKVVATIETSKGTIVLELDAVASPITVENFRKYANDKFYDGLIFHRVIKDFMIQGGGLYPDMKTKKATYAPIKNESQTNGLFNLRGTIAMARTTAPDSATSQFYINTVDNTFLDGKAQTPGYAVFGKVTGGMDVVDAIEGVATATVGMYEDVPVEDVLINSLTVEDK